ncbi:MAG: APC family permease [Sphingobacterium sp.]|nr:APC family permease [Sphingobacterium sp.]
MDHVRLQRLERLGLRRLRGPRPLAQPAPLAPARHGHRRPPLRRPERLLRLRHRPRRRWKASSPVAGLAAGNLFGPAAETVLSLLVSFALFSSLSAYLILGPRVYYSMARDGIFFKSIAYVDPKCAVPTRSIVLQGAIAAVMVFLGTFEQLLTYMGFSLGIFPLLAVLGVFKLRRTGRSAVKLPGYPVASAVYILAGTAILVLVLPRTPQGIARRPGHRGGRHPRLSLLQEPVRPRQAEAARSRRFRADLTNPAARPILDGEGKGSSRAVR